MATITVIGVGYVGLVTAAGLTHLGHDVTCVDVDVAKIDLLRSGGTPIFEAGLADLIDAGVGAGRLRFQVEHDERSAASAFHFLCVPTPAGPDGAADLTYVAAAATTLGPLLSDVAIIVNKSTVPVGSTRFVEDIIDRPEIQVVSNPEFLREGSAVHDFMHPDRIVIGSKSAAAAERVRDVYQGLDARCLLTDPNSAELIKYAANSFLAVKLSFVNAVASICEEVGADIADVRQGIGLDHRIGLEYFAPGPGWGGSCFPKDTQTMVRIAEQAGYDFRLVQAAIDTNEEQLDRLVARTLAQVQRERAEARVAILGLAFKAGTDDTRNSPALAVIDRLGAAGIGSIRVYDQIARSTNPAIEQVTSALDAAEGADVVLVMTEWPEFANLDLTAIATAMSGHTIVDTRDVVDVEQAAAAGLDLLRIGRRS